MNICANPSCAKETKNRKFCSRSCSATITNATHPRRGATPTCKECGLVRVQQKGRYCNKCREERKAKREEETVQRNLAKISTSSHYVHVRKASIRQDARTVYAKIGNPSCLLCGYSKHIQVCHIRPVNSFPIGTKKSVINNIKNLIGLCPNCHWEFDNGMVSVERIELSIDSFGGCDPSLVTDK